MDPAKLVLPPLVYDGEKKSFPFLRRLIFQTAIAYKFERFLTKPKEAAILALAKELSPAPDGDEAKVARDEIIAKATVYYDFTSPVVASKATTIRLLIPP
jgi:hypothetical protein